MKAIPATYAASLLVSFSLSPNNIHAFSIEKQNVLPKSSRSARRTSPTLLWMQSSKKMGEDIPRRRPHSDLSASFIADVAEQESPNTPLLETVANTLGLHQDASFAMETFLLPVLSASLMITGNTVGAGMLVLPELMQGPGSLLSFGVLTAAWVMNLVSGLAIAQVAIQQKEASGSDVPSSFKEFAEATLPDAASTVSAISIAINTLILAFDIFKAGQIGSSFLPVGEGQLLSYVWGVLLAGLVSTQPLSRLSQVASLLVMGLFGTFASLLLPGLANVHDIGSVLLRGPSVPADQVMDGLMQMTPVVITTLVFQNIVPTVTRLLDYDRTKVTMALTIGSVIPLLMYMAWSVSILGGGIDPSSSLALSGLVSVFSLITVAGSSLGTSMSLSEEFEIILGEQQQEGEGTSIEKPDTFSFASVAAPIGISLLVGQLFSSNITDLLKIAGAFGSPLLYGALPVAMALMQQRVSIENTFATKTRQFQTMVPGGMVGLGALGLGSTALLGSELVETLGHSASML